MTHKTVIVSMKNPGVKDALKLRDKRERSKKKTFLVEGYRECLKAFESDWSFNTLFVSPPHFLGSNESTLIDNIRKTGTHVIELAPHVFEKLSYRDRPDGLLGVVAQQHYSVDDLKKRCESAKVAPVLLLAESIEKPGNLGSILRSADAAGVDGVILCDERVDLFNPNVVRSSVGTLFSMPIVTMSMEEAIVWLEQENINLVASSPDAKELYTETDLKSAVAIAMGSEQWGLSQTCLEAANRRVFIPMLGRADSLNVSAAATLLLFEVIRQRGLRGN